MPPWHPKLVLCRLTALSAIALLAAACGGSSSSTNVTGPSSTRCEPTLAPQSSTMSAAGGNGQIAITLNRECSWSARAEATWITLTSAATGQGEGGVSYSVAANSQTTSRSTGIVINERRVEVSQAAAVCSYALSSPGSTIDAAGGSRTVAVSTQSDACAWTVASEVPWITVGGGASRSGNATVTLQIAANTAASPRSGSVVLAGLTHTVSQAGATLVPPGPGDPACRLVVAPTTLDVSGDTSTRVVGIVASAASCPWTAVSNAPWLTVVSGGSGNGSAAVEIVIASNTTGATRSGTLIIGGQTVTVTQTTAQPAQSECSLSLTPTSQAVSAQGGDYDVRITASNAACAWTASSTAPWITIGGNAIGTANGTVRYTVAANSSTSGRTGRVIIGTETLVVEQEGTAPPPPPPSACTFTVSPTSDRFPVAGGEREVQVTASAARCTWSASGGESWLTIVEGTSGTGNGRVRYRAAPNTATAERSTTLTVAGTAVAVAQDAAAPPPPPTCTFTVAPASDRFPASGGEREVQVTASAPSCAWSATAGASWLTILDVPAGTGNGRVRYRASANTATSERNASLTIAGRSVAIVQDAAAPPPPPCTFTLTPTSQTVPSTGGERSIQVTASAGTCQRTASSGVPWITITSGATGTGSGEVRYTVAANTGGQRTGNLTVEGRAFTVTQDAAPSPSPITVAGTISGFGGSCPNLTFTVSSRTVRTNASTAFVNGGCGGYRNGLTVSVSGTQQPDGSLVATTSTRTDGDDN
ncbi:MAG: BACON domain-containing protein [Vicinamibacterales bacterium]